MDPWDLADWRHAGLAAATMLPFGGPKPTPEQMMEGLLRYDLLRDFPERLVQHYSQEPQFKSDLGASLVFIGDLPEAILRFEEALELAPEDARNHSNLGWAFLEAGRPEEARPSKASTSGTTTASRPGRDTFAGPGRIPGSWSQDSTCLLPVPGGVEPIRLHPLRRRPPP